MSAVNIKRMVLQCLLALLIANLAGTNAAQATESTDEFLTNDVAAIEEPVPATQACEPIAELAGTEGNPDEPAGEGTIEGAGLTTESLATPCSSPNPAPPAQTMPAPVIEDEPEAEPTDEEPIDIEGGSALDESPAGENESINAGSIEIENPETAPTQSNSPEPEPAPSDDSVKDEEIRSELPNDGIDSGSEAADESDPAPESELTSTPITEDPGETGSLDEPLAEPADNQVAGDDVATGPQTTGPETDSEPTSPTDSITALSELLKDACLASPITNLVLGVPCQVSVVLPEGVDSSQLTYVYRWESSASHVAGTTPSSSPFHAFELPTVGSYTLYADVLDAQGSVACTVSHSVTVAEPQISLELSAANTTLGSPINVSVVSDGPLDAFVFNYTWSHNGNWSASEWSSTLKETGSTTASPIWEFNPVYSGGYTLYVDVYGPGGIAKTLSANVDVAQSWSVGEVAVSQDVAYNPGQEIDFSVAIEGAENRTLTYNYTWQRENWGYAGSTFIETGAFTSNSTGRFVPNHSGEYILYVTVKDETSGETTTRAQRLTINRAWELTGVDVQVDGNGLFTPTSTVSWTPVVSGNLEGAQYDSAWQKDEGTDFWASGEKTDEPTTTYRFENLGEGLYAFYVTVTDKYGESETVSKTLWADYSPYPLDRVTSLGTTFAGSTNGVPFEDAIVDAGGHLCWGSRGNWCVTFIWWCFNTSGMGNYFANGLPLSEPQELIDYYDNLGRYSRTMDGIKPGDFVFYRNPASTGHSDHGALCVDVTPWGIWVLEGNNPCVAVNFYSFEFDWLYGYARPLY